MIMARVPCKDYGLGIPEKDYVLSTPARIMAWVSLKRIIAWVPWKDYGFKTPCKLYIHSLYQESLYVKKQILTEHTLEQISV